MCDLHLLLDLVEVYIYIYTTIATNTFLQDPQDGVRAMVVFPSAQIRIRSSVDCDSVSLAAMLDIEIRPLVSFELG